MDQAPPLVVVAVGTDHHPFDRLVAWADTWAARARARVVIQHGTAAAPTRAEGEALLPSERLMELLRTADAVVCHGGPGTIGAARAAGRIPIVVARRPDLGEHVDDHQVRFVARQAAHGRVHAPASEAELHALLDRAVADPGAFVIEADDGRVASTAARFGRLVDDLAGGGPPSARIPVLYVAGWGRSGSTLLARMLGQVPGVFSAGELRDVWLRGAIEDRLCGCGAPFRSCEVWREVGERAFGGWDHLDLPAVQRLRERLDRPWLPPRLLGARLLGARLAPDPDLVRYRDHLARLYAAIAEVTGTSLLVDSSKIPTYSMLLRGVPGIDLRVVHLVRDSRGVVRSWDRHVDRADGSGGAGSGGAGAGSAGSDQLYRYGAVSAAGRYGFYNAMAHGLRWSGVPSRFLRYEDLVADPREHLRGVLAFAGRSARDVELAFLGDGVADLRADHTVDGNPMRLSTGPIALRVDDAWRWEMPATQRALVSTLTAPLLAAYGYRLRG
jgi:UDP-N-acetylglucosamine transferase subunit ALG13